ncbi:putative bifunctional diguanylate cyclase/phosphodiesterase [Aquibium microcysteis]|uniref:putative bifunctional diguanylate cyclase/phosphodiesterase n=1 Tax=Aquibium microcysteis TaxID=675281 RepID=UPI00165D20C2|nr:EAL domain-containing protein [Aquibium microcysteis]
MIQRAYVAALVIIASMLFASFILLNHMIGAQQREEHRVSIAETQRALSQRIVFLANAAQRAAPERQSTIVLALRQATIEFERNYAELLSETKAVPESAARLEAGTIENILYAKPFHLEYFTDGLAANSWRLIASLQTENAPVTSRLVYRGGKERAQMDERLATATMDGYSALRDRLSILSRDHLSRLVAAHRTLFAATLFVLVLVAAFIFRPMALLIGRRTDQLVEARNAMAHNAIHDGLTGLHNRVFLNYRFGTFLEEAATRGHRLAVLQFDLDRFKQINDTLGHAAGDHVLTMTAQRMRRAGGSDDVCIRLGGDEFVVIVPHALDDAGVAATAERILRLINQPIEFEGQTIHAGASAGIAFFPEDGREPSELLNHADVALYAAKKSGGGAFSFFNGELRRELEERKEIERELVMSIARRDFAVRFQPQVSLGHGAVTGIEALVRWHPPGRDFVSPAIFLPIAEKSGLMPAIGRIVFREAIVAAARWHKQGLQFGRLALNASGSELAQQDFARFLFDTLAETGLPPHRLALEIVESVILDDEKTGIAATLRTIRAAGVHLELDDFGTGYASLTHVDPRQIDRIKIDRRFVQNIQDNDQNAHIVRAVIDLADRLGIGIIAEGAETDAELAELAALGCDEVQGFGIAFPMPEDAMSAWLAGGATSLRRGDADTGENGRDAA